MKRMMAFVMTALIVLVSASAGLAAGKALPNIKGTWKAVPKQSKAEKKTNPMKPALFIIEEQTGADFKGRVEYTNKKGEHIVDDVSGWLSPDGKKIYVGESRSDAVAGDVHSSKSMDIAVDLRNDDLPKVVIFKLTKTAAKK